MAAYVMEGPFNRLIAIFFIRTGHKVRLSRRAYSRLNTITAQSHKELPLLRRGNQLTSGRQIESDISPSRSTTPTIALASSLVGLLSSKAPSLPLKGGMITTAALFGFESFAFIELGVGTDTLDSEELGVSR